MSFVYWYLSVGAAIYILAVIGDALTGFKSFKRANMLSIVRGAVGALVWPYMIIVIIGDL